MFYAIGRLSGRLVLPDSHHRPARLGQATVSISIPSTIGLDLVPPEFGVVLGPGPVQRASMPETAVDEDGKALAGEDDVRHPSRLRHHLVPHTVS